MKSANIMPRLVLVLFFTVYALSSTAAHAVNWARSYGGAENDECQSLLPTPDGGFLTVGFTESFGAGGKDAWVLKLDSSGNVMWQKAYGGAQDEIASAVQQTPGGDYIVGALTGSFGAGDSDIWVFKIDTSGDILWQKSYGGSGEDVLNVLLHTSDGGCLAAGYTASFGVMNEAYWILRLNSTGDVLWQKTYDAGGQQNVATMNAIPDEGWLVTGKTGYEQLVMRIDDAGAILWQKKFNWGYGKDIAFSLLRNPGGSFTAAGYTFLSNNKYYLWVFEMDAAGNMIWQKQYGGDEHDMAREIAPTADGEYVVAGFTESFGQGAAGSSDLWILKITREGGIDDSCEFISDTSAAASAISLTVSTTSVTPGVTNATTTLTNVNGEPSGASIVEQCANCVLEVAPAAPILTTSATQQFTVSGGVGAINWTLAQNESGSLTTSGSGEAFGYTAGPIGGVDIIQAADIGGCRTAQAMIVIHVPPDDVSELTVSSGHKEVAMSWTNPDAGDLAGVLVLRKSTGFPSGPDDPDAHVVLNALETGVTDSGLVNGTTYYYTIWVHDGSSAYSEGVSVEATPVAAGYIDIDVVSDLDGSGYPELAVLRLDPSINKPVVCIKDADSDTLIRKIWFFGHRWTPSR